MTLSCDKKIEKFVPTTKLATILKDDEINKIYYNFRMENPYLSYMLTDNKIFIKFINDAKINDLLLLAECENPKVRCFAFKALIEKNYPKIREVLFKHKYDDEGVEYLSDIVLE